MLPSEMMSWQPEFTDKTLSENRGGSLALNIIVLWNTIYMDAAIQHLRREEYPVRIQTLRNCHHYSAGILICKGAIHL